MGALAGFNSDALNTTYKEQRKSELFVNNREIYRSLDGEHFIYWCNKDSRWKGSRMTYLQRIQNGASLSCIGAPMGADILSPSLLQGWYELYQKKWIFIQNAGVASFSESTRTSPRKPFVQSSIQRHAEAKNVENKRKMRKQSQPQGG